jgi:EmrB/QacA subfamily drug resistance transporter
MKPKNLWALIGTLVAVANIGLCFAAVNMLVGVIKPDLHASVVQMQWVVNTYGILGTSLLVVMGRLADNFGRKKVYIAGCVAMLIAMIIATITPDAAGLIVAMVFFGIAGAVMMPVSQVLVVSAFPQNKHSHAIGLWSAIAGVSMGLSPVIAGLVTHYLSWRWMFGLVGITTLIGTALVMLFVEESLDKARQKSVDWAGACLLVVAVASFVLGILQSNQWPHFVILALFIITLISAITLLINERRAQNPIIRQECFTHRMFLCGSITNSLLVFFVWASLFLMPYFLITVQHFSTVKVGLLMLFVMVPLTLLSQLSGRLYHSVGPRALILLGFICLMLSALVQHSFTPHTDIGWIVAGMVLFGLGWGFAWGASASTALNAFTQRQATVASGSFITLQELGGTLGLAIVVTVVRYQPTFMQGYHEGMRVLLVFCVVAIGVACFIRRK